MVQRAAGPVRGGQEGEGKITLEQRAEPGSAVRSGFPDSKRLRTPPLPGRLEWPWSFPAARRVVPAEDVSPLSLSGDRGVFFFERSGFYELPPMWTPYGGGDDAHPKIPILDSGITVFPAVPTDVVELGPHGDDTTSMFTRDPFPQFPHTMLCRHCGLVTFLCNLIEKSKKDLK